MPTYDDLIDQKIAEEAPVCRSLRTKALHVYGPDTPDAFVSSQSSSYQCLRTQFVTGPDGGLCAPEECQPERGCFRPR